MAIDFKNIVFKYARIVGGVPSIDTDMTDAKFFATKPVGYYRCFIFPKAYFSGNEYDDLKNLVDIEEKNMWDRVNRDTLLGYNEETNTFICNICAYMGLKDPDLKTDGEMPHPGMAGLYEMELTATSAQGIIKLKQIDGSNIYLKIKPQKNVPKTGYGYILSGNACVENVKKTIADIPVLKKEGALWSKSSEDNSVLLVRTNVSSDSVYANSNKLIDISYFKYYDQAISNGKPLLYFSDTSNTNKYRISGYLDSYMIPNETGKQRVDYTETSNIADIVKPNEAVIFNMSPYQKYLNLSGSSNSRIIYYAISFEINGYSEDDATFKIDFCLKSYDPNNKPFVFNPIKGSLYAFDTVYNGSCNINISKFKENLPDGYIALFSSHLYTQGRYEGTYVYMVKKGANIKKSNTRSKITTVNEATNYPENIYDTYETPSTKVIFDKISKANLIDGIGFSDYSDDFIVCGDRMNSLCTIINVNDA